MGAIILCSVLEQVAVGGRGLAVGGGRAEPCSGSSRVHQAEQEVGSLKGTLGAFPADLDARPVCVAAAWATSAAHDAAGYVAPCEMGALSQGCVARICLFTGPSSCSCTEMSDWQRWRPE